MSSFILGVVTLAPTGVDVAGGITALITEVGTIIGVVLTGYFAFLAIRKGVSWARRAAG